MTTKDSTLAEASAPRATRVSLRERIKPVPKEFIFIAASALALTGFGIVMVLSATSARAVAAGEAPAFFALRQLGFALVGVPLMLIVSRLPVSFFQKLAWPALAVSVVLQLLVLVPGLGVDIGGNQNWLAIGDVSFQPSELIKLSLALWIAHILLRKRPLLDQWMHVYVPVIAPVSAIVIGAVLAGHDLGTTIVLVLIVLSCLFFAGVRLRIIFAPLLAGMLLLAIFALTSENRMRRIQDLFSDECDYLNECFQATHGVWGLAGGGIFGVGLGNSKEKHDWLPAAANDYIFAIVGEETGLIGALLVLILFGAFAFGAFQIIRKTNDPFVRVAAGGITVWIVGQAIINIGVVVRVFPVLGLPLPFMSQGGTALIAVLLATGVLLAFSRTLVDTKVEGATA